MSLLGFIAQTLGVLTGMWICEGVRWLHRHRVRPEYGTPKPFGWSWSVAHHDYPISGRAFKIGVWGGHLFIPDLDFKEWFVRLWPTRLVITITHIDQEIDEQPGVGYGPRP